MSNYPLYKKICTCGKCGHANIPVIWVEKNMFGDPGYDVCNITCPSCGAKSDGGNSGSGEVGGWVSVADLNRSQAVYEAQCIDAENKIFPGWCCW